MIGGDPAEVSRRLAAKPELARMASDGGATREDAESWFFEDIQHYLYAGDTALHMAAAAFRPAVAERLIAHGADCRARNRRGAEPLHYAADANRQAFEAQRETIAYLVSAGADPNAADDSGVVPLHRAVRTRSLAAVEALLAAGADPVQTEPRRIDAAASRRPADGPWRQRVRAGAGAAGGHHRDSSRARREAVRSRRQGHAGPRGGDQPVGPRARRRRPELTVLVPPAPGRELR